ncbi:Eco57I restriction-modification methylase domain-containing protein [Rhodoferax sp. BAB1]|uniref:Eco57I restriction-modification methylase domain-containing protein n=1 Tax=Rhodoferax sp. BAB1 TaxID=2741720 RepID=UPI0015769F9B|nr:N-6 DNA methylase [Rhodoferax sp. BAB1]QKO20901.1 N-6 DNA methylase [Rhodoferax sp. BAB1]
MTAHDSDQWLERLGYDSGSAFLHRAADGLKGQHRYGPELDVLLDPAGPIRAHAVFDVEGVPTVCFFHDDGLLNDAQRLNDIRRRIWNQNLVSIILVLSGSTVTPVPVSKRANVGTPVQQSAASSHGLFSAADVQSGDLYARHADWFRHEERVDSYLLRNLNEAVRQLTKVAGLSDEQAQQLVGQLLFVSYLEERGIVTDVYRRERKVARMGDLVTQQDSVGILRLLKQLKSDFNGDFLEPSAGEDPVWKSLQPNGYAVAQRFLSGEDMSSGQRRLWGYDFSFLPVELISGIYESFLRDEQDELGAFYTPRNLANLVIDQALGNCEDLGAQRIYDGACGSGILLTTAFRRILTHVEAQRGQLLPLADRITLLKSCIFGSDVSKAACQMTAFSLYLSLLERLQPADLAQLERGEGVKLPKLRGENLFSGAAGDFFDTKNKLVSKPSFTVFICNPPWKEPKKGAQSSADTWTESQGGAVVRRQMAAAFAHRALDCVESTGRLCLILPVSLFLAPTSQRFVSEWLSKVKLHRLINFGDLRDLLFDRAHHACVVALATPRARNQQFVPVAEQFEYWVPKADTSLAMGRLTLRGEDRQWVQTQRIVSSNQALTTLSWGGPVDIALCARLRLHGRLDDMANGRFGSWQIRKGVHLNDASRPLQSATKLHAMPHIPVKIVQGSLPFVDEGLLDNFPREQKKVVGLDKELLAVFSGPRVVFPDGPSPGLEVRAHFISASASFTSSVGVVSGPEEDADLLKFLAVYLRSDLVRYFVVMSQYSVLVAQDRITLKDIKSLPFVPPARHPNPEKARAIVAEAAQAVADVQGCDVFEQDRRYQQLRRKLQKLIFQYFGLSQSETLLVQEVVRDVIPSIQPRGFSTLRTELQLDAPLDKLSDYAEALRAELVAWRDATSGRGDFEVTVQAATAGQGRFAVVRVNLVAAAGNAKAAPAVEADKAVQATIRMLQDRQLLPMRVTSNIFLAADVVLLVDSSAYIIKPMQRRAWLRRSALQDAQRIVQTARGVGEIPRAEAA